MRLPFFCEGTTGSERERELSFFFPPRDAEEEATSEPRIKDRDAGQLSDDPEDRWSMTSAATRIEEPFTIAGDESSRSPGTGGEGTLASESRSDASVSEETANILALEPYRDQRASTLPYLTLFGLLILFFSMLTAMDQAYPRAMEGFLKNLPGFGVSILKNDHLKTAVALESLRSDYQNILGNREVFVVTGIARNQNPVAIRDVKIAARLYDGEGKEVEEQAIWIGNAISPRIVRGMTAQDISDLQRLKPLRSFEIPPGDSVPFTIVFLRPSKSIDNFSCQVLAAEGVG